MEETGFGKKWVLSPSSSSSSASRLSPLAQPFTITRPPVGQPQSLNSLTSLNHKPFAPSPSNHLDHFDDSSLLSNSFSDTPTLGDDKLLPVSAPAYNNNNNNNNTPPYSSSASAHQSDSLQSVSIFPFDDHGYDPLEFVVETSISQYPLGESHGYFESSSVSTGTETDPLAKSSVSTYTQCSSYGGQGKAADGKNFVFSKERGPSAGEGLLKEDSKLTSYKVSTMSDVLSSSMLQNTSQDPMYESSANGTNFSPSSHYLSKNVDFTGNSVASNHKSSSVWNVSSNGEIHVLVDTKRKEIHQDKGLVDKGKEIKNAKSQPFKVLDPSIIGKSEAQVTSDDILDGSVMERSGTITSISTKSSSKVLEENESDLDSPCWKGIQNSTKTLDIASESLSTNPPRNEPEAGTKNLNPQAPQFFPSHAKGSIDYLQNNFFQGFPSFEEGEYSSFNLSYKEQPLIDSFKAGSKMPELINTTSYQHSGDTNEPRKESAVLENSKNSFTFNSPQMIKPCLVNGFFTSKGLPVKGVSGEGLADGIMGAANKNPAYLSVLAAEQIPNTLSSGVGAPNECSEMLEYLTQSLSKCPKINVAVLLNTIRCLSDLLVQNCSNDLDSLNEHEHEMIRHIINNLYVLSKHRIGEKTPMLDLLHTGSLNYRDNSMATNELSNIEFQVIPKAKDLVVRCELESWSDHAWQNSYSPRPTRKTQDLVPSSRDEGSSERGNAIVRVLRKALKENQQIDEEIHPQALLNLWLEAEGALCSMRYENSILRMKLQMDGSKAEQR